MSLFDLFKHPPADTPVTVDNSAYDFLPKHKTSTYAADEAFDPDFIPDGGWDVWCANFSRVGKIARIIRARSKTAMTFDWVGEDEDAVKLVQDMSRRTHMSTFFITAWMDWLDFGRTFIEPVWETEAKKELTKIKVVSPASMRVFRDNEQDVKDLKDWLAGGKHVADAAAMEAGSGNNIIGYVQNWSKKDEDKAIFFLPEDLIFIPRYPDHSRMNGSSILQENYNVIMNKLGLEGSQAILAKRWVDPQAITILPKSWWGKMKEVIAQIDAGKIAGTDRYFPEGAEVKLIEPTGNPAAVIRAQVHTEDQLNAGLDWADSFTTSTSSNRSVGELQMQFYERELVPERKIFSDVIEDAIIHPYVRAQMGENVELPVMVFADVTPKSQLEWGKLAKDLLPHMTDTQKRNYFKELGYPVPVDEELPQPVQAPEPTDPAEADPTATDQHADLASAKVPRAVSGPAKSARETMIDEVKKLQDDVANILGVE